MAIYVNVHVNFNVLLIKIFENNLNKIFEKYIKDKIYLCVLVRFILCLVFYFTFFIFFIMYI